ncbi:hypothetical protein [Enterococcus alishanensis]
MLDLYLQQVNDCCSCFECIEEEEKKSAILTALETWGTLTCGNWINEHQLSIRVPLHKKCGGCCPEVYSINLIEEWVQVDTIKVTLRTWEGIKVDKTNLNFYFDEHTHELLIDLTDMLDCCNRCTKYDLIIDYTVGTDEIPPELCEWFCAIARVYITLKDINCASCGSQSTDDIAYVEVDGNDLGAVFKRMAVKYFELVINKYSLCEYRALCDWTVVR